MGSNCSIAYQDVNSNDGFHPNQGFTAGWQTMFPVQQPPIGWYGAEQVNLLSRILLRISLAEPKAKFKKMIQLVYSKRKRRPRPRLRQNRGQKRMKKTMGKLHPRTPTIDTYYCIVLLSLMSFLIRWMT
jgi:hypothetical protein